MHPTDFVRTTRHPHPEVGADGATRLVGEVGGPHSGEAKRVFMWVERNLTSLTRVVPMAEIKDMPPSMQPHIVGVPRTWVQLFQC
jgi:hypothetical protein